MSRRLAAVLATAVIASAAAFAPPAPSSGRSSEEQDGVRERAHDPDPQEARDRPVGEQPRDAPEVGDRRADDVHARVGVVDPVDRHLVDPQPAPLREHQQLGVEEPALVLDVVEQVLERVAADGLEAALGVAEAGAQDGVEDAVVAARDELALRAADDPRAVREPRADREVAVTGHQRRDEREQAAQIGREVDVHVGHDARVARLPGGAQRAAAALAVEAQMADPRQRVRELGGDLGRGVDAGVVGDHDPPGEREAVGEEAVEAADAALQAGGLVVDGNDDLNVRRRGGREGPPGGEEGGGEL